MSKLSKIFRAIHLLIKKPSLINQITESNEAYLLECRQNQLLYQEFAQTPLSFFTGNDIPEVTPFAMMDGGSLPIDLALLKAIARKFSVQNYFEIGTWRGESAANLASEAKNVYTLNLSDNELQLLGKDAQYIRQQSWFSKNLKNIQHLKGNSSTINLKKFEGKMDLVFVDGDHRYEAVKKDSETAFRLIKPETGIIVWHDYGSSPELVRYEVLKGIVDGTPTKWRKNLRAVEHTLCAVFSFQELKGKPYQYPNDPTKHFSIAIHQR